MKNKFELIVNKKNEEIVKDEDDFIILCQDLYDETLGFLGFFNKLTDIYYGFFEYEYKESFLNVFDDEILKIRYGSSTMTYFKMLYSVMIKHDFEYEESKNKKHKSEYYVNKFVKDNFNKIFPNYIFIKDEYIVKNIGKIDILAKDKISGRDVIIEVKKDKENPNKQLLAYSKEFDNPILIGITNMDSKYYLKNIRYIKVSDIING